MAEDERYLKPTTMRLSFSFQTNHKNEDATVMELITNCHMRIHERVAFERMK